MKILFIVIGPVSFKSVNYLRAFIKQLDLSVHKVTILSEILNKEYLESDARIRKVDIGQDFSDKDFQSLLAFEFDLVIIVNTEFLLFEEKASLFKKSYFQQLENHDVLFFVTGDYLLFKNNSVYYEDNPKNKIKFNFPYGIIKPSPPYVAELDDVKYESPVFYWQSLETFAFLNKDESRTALKEKIQSKKETLLISVIVDLEEFISACGMKFQYHYKILIECIAYYLSKLDIECDLVIGNIPRIKLDDAYENVKIRFLGPLTESDSDMLLRASDLVITESIANPILIEAANLKVPVINMRNSLITEIKTDEEGEYNSIIHPFTELTPFIQAKVEELINNCEESLFNYLAFPKKASVVYNQIKVFGFYIFNFCELFYEKQAIELFNSLLINQETRKAEIYRIEQYLAMRSDTLDAQEIINSIFNISIEEDEE